jgi:hypothetical protein
LWLLWLTPLLLLLLLPLLLLLLLLLQATLMRCGCWGACCQCSQPGWPKRCRHTGRQHTGR